MLSSLYIADVISHKVHSHGQLKREDLFQIDYYRVASTDKCIDDRLILSAVNGQHLIVRCERLIGD